MKTIKLILFVAGITTAALFIYSCQSTKTSTAAKLLKFNFEKGKGYDYEMTMSMDQEVAGQSVQMDMTSYYSMDVVGEEGPNKTITSQIDRFKMKVGAMGFSLDIDTDKPLPSLGLTEDGKDPMKAVNSLLGAIKGQKFEMKINAEGKVLEIKGFENMAKKIVDSLGVDESEKEQMMQEFSKQFNGDKMRGQFERSWYIFPNKEVKVGDTWQKNTSTEMDDLGGGSYSSVYKVTDIEGDMVTLEEETKIESNQAGRQMSGEISGTIVVDSRVGLIVKADQDISLKPMTDNTKGIEIKAKIKVKGKAR
ncbi:MAG: hypothetical protein HZB42_00100 [Sphingobacteriales bacterium]|nr:hypothetical protein [Sphingobacteriales bacterium]